MNTYRLGLEVGGLMEDPERRLENIKVIKASTLDEAKLLYAKITGLDKEKCWNSKSMTYWGYRIIKVEDFYK